MRYRKKFEHVDKKYNYVLFINLIANNLENKCIKISFLFI